MSDRDALDDDDKLFRKRIRKIAADISNSESDAEVDQIMGPLTRTETEAVVAFLEVEERIWKHHAAWVERERAKGRPEAELTWSNCVRETGMFCDGWDGIVSSGLKQ